MKRLALFACLSALGAQALSTNTWAADLHITAGSTFIVDASKANLNLDELVIDDKAQIKLAEGVDLWVVNAKQAKIGYGVVINGSGSAGRDGAHGISHREAETCAPGKAGSDGGLGGGGGSGASVHWSLGVVSFGTVKVDLSGGNGGRGGVGGDGQNVPNFAGCKASGGAAGAGGAGGAGGKGGTFRFHYSLMSDIVEDLTNSIVVKISGGLRGKGGQPGLAGVGTSGHYDKAGNADRNWLPSGGDGVQGVEGKAGASGANGSLDIRRINDDASTAVAPAHEKEVPDADLTKKVKDLEILTQKLEARIRLLELDKK